MAQGYAKQQISPTGAQGPQGMTGPMGAAGYTGMMGPTGPMGPAGADGSQITTGQATINFGSAPGTNIVSVVVTGQTGILTTSTVSAFMMADTTVSGASGHNAEEHKFAQIKFTCGNIVAGTGFTIWAETEWRLTSTFNVRWMWSL